MSVCKGLFCYNLTKLKQTLANENIMFIEISKKNCDISFKKYDKSRNIETV